MDVVGLSSGVKSISAGEGLSTCAVTGTGVDCWGYNYYGLLGDGTSGTSSSTSSAGSVSGLSNGASVSGGTYSSCAVTSTGEAECWGNNYYGEIGNGTESNSTSVDTDTPAEVTF